MQDQSFQAAVVDQSPSPVRGPLMQATAMSQAIMYLAYCRSFTTQILKGGADFMELRSAHRLPDST
eukprot:3160233-Amphidinium_carterae.1